MQLAHRVALNGQQMDSVDERIIIKAVEEGAGKETVSAVGRASGSGQRITARRRNTVSVTVKFSINVDESDMETRGTILEAVNRWACGGGILTLNYKPGRQLRVILAQAPGAGDLYEWTSVYSLVFDAYGVPYWEDAAGSTVRSQGTSGGSLNIGVNGSAETVLEFSFKNTGGSVCDTLTVRADGRSIAFEGLGLGSGETLALDHDENGLQRILIGSRSAMAARTVLSADELRVKPGAVGVTWTAGTAGTMTISCRGRYL